MQNRRAFRAAAGYGARSLPGAQAAPARMKPWMARLGGFARATTLATVTAVTAVAALGGCAALPSELNLSPLYRHRLDEDGSLRQLDVLWPFFFWRRTDDGGVDFRVRPFYRYVTDGTAAPDADEHQFLAPLGRVRHAHGETLSRLFPLWFFKAREDDEGLRETDWNAALLLWGGTREDGEENYFAFLPFYADIPDFLTYDRFQTHLFPLHVALEKNGSRSHQFLWPLIGFGSNEAGDKRWHRALPFYAANVDEGRYERYSALWPFVHWGYENLDTADPIQRFFLFPLFGRQTSDKIDAWTALWPLFSKIAIQDRLLKLDVLWPIFRYHRDESEFVQLNQWWVWPLIGRTETPTQRAWNFLWPLIWLREYDDPESHLAQTWVLPFYWSSTREHDDGGCDDYVKVWPLMHHEDTRDESGEWSTLSPWFWRRGNSAGVDEAYDWLWTLAHREWSPRGDAFDLAAHLYTTEKRDGRRQTSVPFLFNYESDASGATLRLFQFLPISLGAGDTPPPDR
ncbi:MAG: hypothetical protein AAF628_21100 [Planctomycetota bacterium]